MTLSPSTVRTDLKCGKGAISKGEKCHKGPAQKVVEKVAPIALGLGLAAGAIALRRRAKQNSSSTRERSIPKIPKTPPKPGTVSSPATREQAKAMAQRVIERNERRSPTQRSTEPTLREQRLNRLTDRKMESHLTNRGVPSDAIKTDEKHNFKYGVTPEDKWLGVAYTSKDNKISVSRTKGGEIEFRVNDDTERNEFSNARSEVRSVLNKVEQMLQASLADLPDSKRVFAFAEEGDNQFSARFKLYKRYGFKPSERDPFLLEATVGELKRRQRRTDALTPLFLRLDLKCGKGAISKGEKCTKGPATAAKVAVGVGLTAGAIALGAAALSRRSPRGRTNPSASRPSPAGGPPKPTPSTPQLTGTSPRGLLKAATPRRSKTQRMRDNTAAAMRNAESRIAQTAREEVRRIAQIGNTMATTGEATGMAAKTALREIRLRTEAARRRFEPGYRIAKPPAPKAPAQLPEGGSTEFTIPVTNPQPLTPEVIAVDPRTGQPRRRRPQGFGRSDSGVQFLHTQYIDPARR